MPTKLVFERIFTKAFCQYILNLMPKKKLGRFNVWINTFFQSFICLPWYKHFLVSIFVPFPWRCWTEFSQSRKDLRKTFQSHENIQFIQKIWVLHWFLFKFKRLVILNAHDVKNQSINEQKRGVLAKFVNSILYLHKK